MSKSKVQKRANRLQALLDDRENLNRRIREARESLYSDLGRAVYDAMNDSKNPLAPLMMIQEIYDQHCGDDLPITDRPDEVQDAYRRFLDQRESTRIALASGDESKSDYFGFEESSGDSGGDSGVSGDYHGQHWA